MAAVEVDDLTEECDLLHAAIREGSDFVGDFLNRPSTLLAARLRHNAKRAVHVAALHDRNKCRDLALFDLLLADRALGAGLLLGVHNRPALVIDQRMHAGFQEIVHIVRHAVEFLCAHHKIDMRGGL